MNLVMGCDPHLDTITVAVIHPSGRPLLQAAVPNSKAGWSQTLRWALTHRVATVGIEAASGYGQNLARTLTQAGISVVEIPTRVTVTWRHTEGDHKTDPGDARAIARATSAGRGHQWADTPQLEALRAVVAHRRSLTQTQNRETNQLRALLTELDPQRAATLNRLRTIRSLTPFTRIRYQTSIRTQTISHLIRQLATTLITRRRNIDQLTRSLHHLLPPQAHQLIAHTNGLGTIGAATLFAELAGTAGFTTDARFAAWAGVAPLDASSGRQQRHRLNRGGNRQVNAVIHTIVITQLRHHGPAATYITRRLTEGKTRKEAIRACKRHIARTLWKQLNNPTN